MMLEPIVTHVAHAGWDEHDYFGHKLFSELAGSESYAGLLAFAVTGRRVSKDVAAMLDDVAAVVALGEPRIWPLKLTRLGSAYGRTLPGIVVGNLCFETDLLGPMILGDAASLFLELEKIADDQKIIEAVAPRVAKRNVPGFGVPFRDVDERLVALVECVKRRGRDQLPHWQFANSAWKTLRAAHGLIPNVAGAIAALFLDCGFTPAQVGPLLFSLMQSVMLANAFEGAAQAPEVLRQLPDDAIEYVGQAPRISPRAIALDDLSKKSAVAANIAVSSA
ncbi:MAG: hypothetical protein ABI183_19660, partial [Polyangiaceae bacterium]